MLDIFDTEFNPELLRSLRYQTPFFLFSKKRVLEKFRQFKKHFPTAGIYYAMKANSDPEILRVLARAGSGFEVASTYELKMLKKLKVSPSRIIYGTSVKPASHIKDFYRYGVKVYAFDSFPELEKIAATAPKSKVYVRIAANDTGSVFKFSEKFGTEVENVVPMLQRAKELGLEPYGISFHVGSQASNILAWAQGLERISKTLDHLMKIGIKLKILNIGGGFPCLYASTENELELKEIADHTLKTYRKLSYQPTLIMEPGRGIIAETGVLVATVIERVERGGNTWLFLDAGVYNALYEAMAYQGSTRYKATCLRPSFDAGEKLFSLAGPTGDSPDIITKEALLPQDMAVGDKIVFHHVGAYSLSTSNHFNGFPTPSVYYI